MLAEIPIGSAELPGATVVLGMGPGGDPGCEYADPGDETRIEGARVGFRQHLRAGEARAQRRLRPFADAGLSFGSDRTVSLREGAEAVRANVRSGNRWWDARADSPDLAGKYAREPLDAGEIPARLCP